jgi:hypothetical protein
MPAIEKVRNLPSGLLGGLLFFAVVAAGAAYIIFSKLHGFGALAVTLVPVLIMIFYALVLGVARLFRLRDDQSGDNLYYMGFLFTLTSLAVSLYQFSAVGSAEQIVQNFGIAIATTIAGITLRIFFNQMRRDPIEVEHTARLELAEASRKVRRELEGTVLEFSYFRRATQQSITEALDEVTTTLNQARDRIINQLEEFARASTTPLERASAQSGATIEEVSTRISRAFDATAAQIRDASGELSRSSTALVTSINTVVSRLTAMQTPEHIIEIKLSPMIQGLSRAVNTFTRNAETQAKAVDNNLKQTQELAANIAALLAELRAARIPAALEAGIASLLEEMRTTRQTDGISHPVDDTAAALSSPSGLGRDLTSKAM